MRKFLYTIFVCILSFAVNCHGYHNKFVNIKRFTPLVTVKTKPLSTVSTKYLFGNIPRLEIGLRFLRSLPQSYYDKIIYVNPMEWLTDGRMSGDYRHHRRKFYPGKIISRIKSGLRSIATSFVSYVKKVMATAVVMSSTISFPNLNFKRVTMAAGSSALVSMIPNIAHAGVLKKYSKLSPTQKLATTPLFFVCSSQGNPYLQDDVQAGKPDQKIVVYFMSSEDANDYLSEIAQGNAGNVNEFRVMTTSMEKIVNKIESRKQSRKLGRYSMGIVYRIQPSSRQCENAERVAGAGDAGKGRDKLKGVSIPMFSAKGMSIKRSTGEMVTPYYFAYEDLLDDWGKVAIESESDKLPSKPNVVVRDFVEVMCLSQGIHAESLSADSSIMSVNEEIPDVLKTPAIVPPRREIATLKKFYRDRSDEFQPARIMGLPRKQ